MVNFHDLIHNLVLNLYSIMSLHLYSVPDEEAICHRMVLVCGTSTCHMAVSKNKLFVPGVWGPFWSGTVLSHMYFVFLLPSNHISVLNNFLPASLLIFFILSYFLSFVDHAG